MARLLISAGEASGDLLAAELLEQLQDDGDPVEAFGVGGPALRAAGMDVRVDAASLAVVGLAEAVGRVPAALAALRRLDRALAREPVDAVVLVDAPDFNIPLARRAAARGVPVIYYVSPQVWAWRRGRLRALARHVDRVLTLLPFEPALYQAEGVPVTHVGHPLVDRVAPHVAAREPAGDVVALLPGSREGEIGALWPVFVETARRVAREVPGVRFVVPRAPTVEPALLPVPDDVPIEVTDGPAGRELAGATCALVASGTATLEAALCGTPHAVAYRVHPATYRLGRALVRGVRHVALSNLVATGGPGEAPAGAPVAPEFLQELDPEAIARPLVAWLRDDALRGEVRAQLERVREAIGPGGAAARAAAAVREELASREGVHPAAERAAGGVPAVSPREGWVLAGLAVALVAARLALTLPYAPHPDEAYFWRWSLDPAWGYFDQPPMVAWCLAAARALLGDTALAIRLPAALCTAGAAALVYLAAREHAPPGRAWWAPALLLVTPLVAVGGLLTTPDAPLSLAWAGFLYAATRAAAPRRGRAPPADRWLAPWIGLGLLLGLGLLSKLTMGLAAAGLGLWWLLRRPRPWRGPLAAAATAAAVTAPWWVWNATHGFAPFAWEMSHGLSPQQGSPWLRLGEFLGQQAGLAGPLLVVAAVVLADRLLLRRRGAPHERLWGALSLTVLAAFGVASLAARSNGNWAAMAYPALACWIAVSAKPWLRVSSLVTSGALGALAVAHVIQPLPFVPPSLDPLADTAGYDELAAEVERELARKPAGTLAVASRYQDAAALAFALDDPRRVVDQPGRGRPNQWDLWDLEEPVIPPGTPVVYVSLGPARGIRCEPRRWVDLEYRHETVRNYVFYSCLPPEDDAPWRRPGTEPRQ